MKNPLRAATTSLLLTLAAATATQASDYAGLGFFANNLDGNNASNEAIFESNYSAFTSTVGQQAHYLDLFVDYTSPIANWVNNAGWEAWSMSKSPLAGATPVVSVGLVDAPTGLPGGNYYRAGSLAMLQAVAAGNYDSTFLGILQQIYNNGYHTIYLRLGWEQNGASWEPWYACGDSTAAAAYVAAWQRVANIAHNINNAGVANMNVKTVWSPACTNWTPTSTDTTYPGDPYVDVVAPDLYSPVAPPPDLWDYSTGQVDASPTAWAANPVNREHYWDYPAANEWSQTSDGGYGLVHAINFAISHNKAFGLTETGAGDKSGFYGPTDEGDFPSYLANRLTAAISNGLAVAFVNVWNDDPGDGNWRFTDGDRPNESAAWKQFAQTMAAATATTPQGTMTLSQGATTGTTMVVSWPAIPGATSYTIGYNSQNIGYASVTTSATSVTLTGLQPSTWYWVKGVPSNSAGNGTWTGTYSFETGQNVQTPQGTMTLSQGTTTGTTMVVSWAAIPGATSYTIGYNSQNIGYVSVTTSATSVTLTGLLPSTWYWVKGVPSNSAGSGTWTGTYSFETGQSSQPPTGTMSLLQGATTGTTMVVSWSAIQGATSYTIGYNSQSTAYASMTTSGTSVTLTGLQPNTWYWIDGAPSNSAGSGTWTGIYSFLTGANEPNSPAAFRTTQTRVAPRSAPSLQRTERIGAHSFLTTSSQAGPAKRRPVRRRPSLPARTSSRPWGRRACARRA